MLGKVATITNKSRNYALGVLGFEPTTLLTDSPEQTRGVLFVAVMKKEGVAITRRLQEAGEIMGIKVLDHVIVGEGGYLSFVERGLL